MVAANVLHNAIIARHGLNNLRQLLAPGGWLLIIEATRDNYQLMTPMEFKQGLTAFEDERLALDSPFATTKLDTCTTGCRSRNAMGLSTHG